MRSQELTTGGVLASSRTSVSRDDRGAAFTALIGDLTVYQLRAHYILYTAIRSACADETGSIATPSVRTQCEMFLPLAEYMTAMSPEPGETADALMHHAFFGLHKQGLLAEQFVYGNEEHVRSRAPNARAPGFVYGPSVLGAELYLWALAKSTPSVERFFVQEVARLSEVPACPGAIRVRDMAPRAA